MNEPDKLTHVDADGRARMVDVSGKPETRRQARAQAVVHMRQDVLEKLQAGELEKGDALTVARLAGIQAAKRTPDLVPLCHGVLLDHIDIEAHVDRQNSCVLLQSAVVCRGATGVEMEAIVAVSIAAVTIYDMCKALDRGIVIDGIELLQKSGGRSGTYVRNNVSRG